MRTFSAQGVLVLALWVVGLALGQDTPVTTSIDQGDAPLTDAPLDATTTSLEISDPEPTEPTVEDLTQTISESGPNDGGTFPTEVTGNPTEGPTSTEASVTTPSSTTVADATSTEDVTS